MSQDPRILVVDDEPRSAELLARVLRRLGHVETASSAEQAWEMVQHEDVDVVISDQRMPGMTGVELLGRIAARDESGTGRILITGYTDLDATIDAINLGRVHAYLRKPCGPELMEEAVRSVLERVRGHSTERD